MIDAHRAGVAHGRAQHLAERLEAARDKAVRIVRGEAPVLAGRIELVGRRADRQSAQHDALLHPGVGAAGIDADRGVEIEADRQAAPRARCRGSVRAGARRSIAGIRESRCRRDGLRAIAATRHRRAAAIPPAIPAMRRNAVAASVSKAAKHSSARPRSCPIGCEILARRSSLPFAAKLRYAARNAAIFERRDRRIIDQFGVAQPGNISGETVPHDAVELLDRLDVDIERIEEQPAVRRVRAAGACRPVIELRVQRVEADACAAEIGDDFQQDPRDR